MSNSVSYNARGEREFMGFNLFDQDTLYLRKSWNVLNTFLNIFGLKGREVAIKYLSHTDVETRKQVKEMYEMILKEGMSETKKKVLRMSNAQG